MALRELPVQDANTLNIDDEEFDEPMTLDEATAMEQMENAAPKSKKKKKKKRRRSSAKFLRLSEKFDIEGDDENDVMNDDKLGEMYSKAVGMSQANKINAQNSWSLNLIDNIDRIINGPLNSPAPKAKKNKGASGAVEKKKKNGFGNDDDADYEPSINFAKASCTLDASVKIWSYRVDDVHTSSYKVLANLNRTDNDNEEKKVAKVGERKQSERRGLSVKTLETNVDAINMNKLDAAFDIDPLFHKMSKTFDEGGAKGMLLSNLGVAPEGPQIVFDSKADSLDEEVGLAAMASSDETAKKNENDDIGHRYVLDEQINISGLNRKLTSLLKSARLEDLQLVPQLEDLRKEYQVLKAEGYTGSKIAVSSAKYGDSKAEEKKAEEEIVRAEAEKKRKMSDELPESDDATPSSIPEETQADVPETNSVAATLNAETQAEAEADAAFDNCMDDIMDDGGMDMYEDVDVCNNLFDTNNNAASVARVSLENAVNVEVVIDAIAEGKTRPTRSTKTNSSNNNTENYRYFDEKSIVETAQAGNNWAGAAHWKRGKKAKKDKDIIEESEAASRGKKKGKGKGKKKNINTLIDLTAEVDESMFKAQTKGRSRSASSATAVTQSDAVLAKQMQNSNLLPWDSGVTVEKLNRFFLRPNAAVQVREKKKGNQNSDSEHDGANINDDNFRDVDQDNDIAFDDGPSFDNDEGGMIGDNDNICSTNNDSDDSFEIGELEGIRKVAKVDVGYATVAKKVDVKRLKHDLWAELAAHPMVVGEEGADEETQIAEDDSVIEKVEANEEENVGERENDDQQEVPKNTNNSTVDVDNQKTLSFSDTIDSMKLAQKQNDVTLPFYFICVLHLANEKGLKLEGSDDLLDFVISKDDGKIVEAILPNAAAKPTKKRVKRVTKVAKYQESDDEDSGFDNSYHDE